MNKVTPFAPVYHSRKLIQSFLVDSIARNGFARYDETRSSSRDETGSLRVKIVVVSDTHMPRMNKKLPDRLIRELKSADAILHAGDWTKLAVYEQLLAYAPTYGVAGNNDGEEIVQKLGLRKMVTLGGCRIGIVHGHGALKRIATEAHAIAEFKGEQVDAIVYGHSHIPVLKQAGEGLPLIFNPGSPTDKRRQAKYSFGIFRIEEGKLLAKHVFYADKS